MDRPVTRPERPTILVAEGDLRLAQSLAETLEDWDYEAVVATSLRQARRALEDVPWIQLVVTSRFLPDGDGVDFVAEVVADDPDIKAIVVSEDSAAAVIERAVAAGAEAFLPVPYSDSELLRTVTAALDNLGVACA